MDFESLRQRMLKQQIAARGVRSPAVLAAIGAVRREGYVPSYLGEFAYDDTPLPIEEEQTISQPYIVAFMIEALRARSRATACSRSGPGSGYAAAVLAEIARRGLHDRAPRGAGRARPRSGSPRDGYDNVHVRCGDGTLGWPEAAPFDAIVVAAGGPRVPEALLRAARGRRATGDPGRRDGRAPEAGPRDAPPGRRVRVRGPGRRALRAAGRRAGLAGAEARRAAAPPDTARRSASPAHVEPFADVATADLEALLARDRRRARRAARRGDARHLGVLRACARASRAS